MTNRKQTRSFGMVVGWLLALSCVMLAACTTPSSSPSQGEGQKPATAQAPAPKQLTIGILEEPKGWAPWVGATTAGGSHQPRWLITRTLTLINDKGQVQPELAVSVPTVEKGDWRINDDGTMEQTWRIKPNARWHDGQPLTADDFVFGWGVETNPALPSLNSLARLHITGAEAPDEQTLILHFKDTTPYAGTALFDPYPRHILADALASDVDQFPNLEYWTTEYIGAGPYRLKTWQPGAFQTFTAFADYIGGKPKIDTVTVRFLQDANTLLANLLAGEVDVALPDGLSIDMAGDLKNGWAAPGTGNNVLLFPDGRVYRLEFQHRSEYAQPAAARDPRVRQAFYYTIDKQAVNEVELNGLGVLADSWIAPDDPRRPQFADAIPEWTHDISRAQRVLEDAGWRRGPDGVAVNASTGERMETEIRATAGQGHLRALAVMASEWRKVGAVVDEVPIAAAMLSNNEYRSTFPFAGLTGHPLNLNWEFTHYACVRVARAETRWSGNRNGYCSATADPLIERLQGTLAEADRTALQVQIMRIVSKEDFAQLYLYWQVTPVAFSQSVVGLGPLNPGPYGGSQSPWNIHLWDKQ